MSDLYNLICGAIAGCVSRTSTAPLELKKLQMQNPFIPNTTIRDVVKKKAFHILWKGNFTNCIRIAPQTAINFTVYNQLKKLNLFDNTNVNNSFLELLELLLQLLLHIHLIMQVLDWHYKQIMDIIILFQMFLKKYL